MTSLARKIPLLRSMASTSVVLPWSTCATMAMLRMSARSRLGSAALASSPPCSGRVLLCVIDRLSGHRNEVSSARLVAHGLTLCYLEGVAARHRLDLLGV